MSAQTAAFILLATILVVALVYAAASAAATFRAARRAFDRAADEAVALTKPLPADLLPETVGGTPVHDALRLEFARRGAQ